MTVDHLLQALQSSSSRLLRSLDQKLMTAAILSFQRSMDLTRFHGHNSVRPRLILSSFTPFVVDGRR